MKKNTMLLLGILFLIINFIINFLMFYFIYSSTGINFRASWIPEILLGSILATIGNPLGWAGIIFIILALFKKNH